MIKLLLIIQKYSLPIFNFLMHIMSLIMCQINVGVIHTPKKNVLFLPYDERQDLYLGATVFQGWPINERLFALDTPGHQNDHLAFYVSDKRIMFAGDLINFLNPNDILDGSIKDTRVGMMKMLQLAEAGGIDIPARSPSSMCMCIYI